MFAPMRKEEVGLLVEEIKEAAVTREVVDITKKVNQVVENITCRMVLGRKKDDEFDLKALIVEGLTKRMKTSSKFIDGLLEKIISEHEKDTSDDDQQHQKSRHKDFIDVLLSMLNQPMNPNEEHGHIIDKKNIKAILLGILGAALDTSSTVIEWTLAEILKHPRIMARLKEELECVMGKKKMVEEKDLVSLPYLDMVIKEGLRFHPVLPLLIPHESMEDITIDGFYIPKKSRIIVNFWAIGHDLSIWSDNVNEFFPERFIGSNVDVRGHDFQLIPFGAGRRGCPGMQLRLSTIKFAVAQLMHCFDWNLPDGMSPNDIDMSERFGLTVGRKNHLLAMPTYRLGV